MERTKINQLKEKVGKKVLVSGWVHEIRDQAKIKFVLMRDVSGIIQAIVTKDKSFFNEIAKIPRESVISIEGAVKAEKQAPGGIELDVESYQMISEAESQLPIQVVERGTEETALPKRLDWRVLDLRRPRNTAIFKIQSKLVESALEWLTSNGFMITFTPCLIGVPAESGSEMFEVEYFGKTAYLRQDPQLHRQLAVIGGAEKIVDIGTSWRAELSNTTRHLTEHRTLAVETSFIKDEYDVMRLEEQLVIAMIKKVLQDCKEELKLFPDANFELPKAPFPVLEFPEVYEILKKLGHKWKKIDPEAERLLAKYVKEKYKSDFFFLNRFPFEEKPFYVMRNDKEPEYARSTDLIYRGVELSSGGQREHRYDKLMDNIESKKMNPKLVEWFTQFFKYGACPHGGFCIGIERITMQFLGLENVREAVLFPRDPQRLTP